MIRIHQQSGHSERDDRIFTKKGYYNPPRVFSEAEILLENDLLGGSTWLMTNIETMGQAMEGLYFGDEDIIRSGSNNWFD